MIITIIASLTEEQALILALEKGYQNKVIENITNEDWTTSSVEVINPISAYEFLRKVYESMIIEDSTKEFMKYKERTYLAEQRLLLETQTRDEVIAWISSIAE